MSLTIRRTGADEYGKYIKALICGDAGTGKTLTSSTWPNPLYASAEGGLMSVADRHIPYVDISTSDQLLKLRQALDQEAPVRAALLKTPVDTIIIDTIDQVQRILVDERKSMTKKDTLAVQDWGWLGDQMRGIIRGFKNLPMHVVFTCHLKKSEDGESGRQFYAPALQGQVGDEIPQYFDLAVLLRGTLLTKVVGDTTKRVQVKLMQTYPDDNHPWIKDRSGKLAAEIELDFDKDFKVIAASIFGDHEMDASSEISDVADRVEVQQRQEEIEKNLASSTGDAPEPPAKAAATKKAAAAKKAAPAKAAAAKKAAPPKADAEPKEKEEQPPAEPEPEPEPEQAPEPAPAAEPAEAPVEGGLKDAEIPPVEELMAPPEETPGQEEQRLAEEAMEQERETATPVAEETTEETTEEAAAEPEEGAEEPEPGKIFCESCGGEVENEDQADLSKIRFRKVLCRTCFKDAKTKQ